ncbi:MAG: Maf family protein [Rhizomicrobium sp.]
MILILASASAARKQVLTAAQVPFAAVPADIDEAGLKDEFLAAGLDVSGVAVRLAEAKAVQVSRAHPGELVLGADQTLLFEGTLVSKCADLAAARALLSRLRGKDHWLVGGLALARDGRVFWRYSETSVLTMRAFSDTFLDAYLSTEGEGILACVGCYRLEGLGAQLFARIEGDYFSILGLSLQPLLTELRNQGVIAT